MYTGVMEDPSELFTETRDIGNRNEHSVFDFQTWCT